MTPPMPAPTPIRAAECAPQPWRNGGGSTRELLAWPAGPHWRLRVSLADIAAAGPFSAFPGVQRWFAVIEGGGVVLSFADAEHRLVPGSAPLCFDGADAPGCQLIDGATSDLNMMLRDGARGCMQPALSGQPWSEAWPWRACFTGGAARWQRAGEAAIDLPANTLLCDLGPARCSLTALDRSAPMFWIGADFASSGESR
jgi:hypothetical protein